MSYLLEPLDDLDKGWPGGCTPDLCWENRIFNPKKGISGNELYPYIIGIWYYLTGSAFEKGKREEDALPFFSKGAISYNNPKCLTKLGRHYISIDPEKSVTCFKRAATVGDKEAKDILFRYYTSKKDFERAAWYRG